MKKMDIDRSIQLLANLGVIAGIVFLAVEIRQNTESLEEGRNLAMAQARQDRASDLDESFRSLANSAYLPGIFVKYEREGIDSLTPEERNRFLWQSCSGLVRLDTIHSWYERGYIDEAEYDVVFRQLVLGYAQRWSDLGIAPARPAYRDAVEDIIEQAGLSIELSNDSRC